MRSLILLIMVITMAACGGGSPIDPAPTQYDRAGYYDMDTGETWRIFGDGGDYILYSPHPDHPATMVDRGELSFNVNEFTMHWRSVDAGGPYPGAGTITADGLRFWLLRDPDAIVTGVRTTKPSS
jgi:hypothetical protein